MGRKGEYENVRATYISIIRELMKFIYPNNPHPRLADYEQAVADYKSKNELKLSGGYCKRDVHTPVYRAIKELERLGEIIHVDNYYYPTDMHTLHTSLDAFEKNIKLSKDTLAIISASTCAIALEEGQDTENIKKTIKNMLSEKNIFSLHVFDNVLFIIMNNNAEQNYMYELSCIVKKAYDIQHNNLN